MFAQESSINFSFCFLFFFFIFLVNLTISFFFPTYFQHLTKRHLKRGRMGNNFLMREKRNGRKLSTPLIKLSDVCCYLCKNIQATLLCIWRRPAAVCRWCVSCWPAVRIQTHRLTTVTAHCIMLPHTLAPTSLVCECVCECLSIFAFVYVCIPCLFATVLPISFSDPCLGQTL